MNNTEQRLVDFIVGELGWAGSRSDLTGDYRLIENDVLDSLGIFEVVGFLESSYDITVDDDELVPENFETLAAIAGLVARKGR